MWPRVNRQGSMRYRISIIVEARPLEATDCAGVATNCSMIDLPRPPEASGGRAWPQPASASGGWCKLSERFVELFGRAINRADARLLERRALERRQTTLFGTGG